MFMKKLLLSRGFVSLKVAFLVIFILLTINLVLFAQEITNYKTPILVTSAGQCVDYKTVSMIVKRLDLEYIENPIIKDEEIKEDTKTIIMVVGHSLKGLGSAGIGEEDELARVNQVLDKAKELEIPVVLFHLGGEMRRGPTSQPFIDAVLEHSEYVVVFNQGNIDKYFTNYTSNNNIPMTEITKVVEALDVLKVMFDLE